MEVEVMAMDLAAVKVEATEVEEKADASYIDMRKKILILTK